MKIYIDPGHSGAPPLDPGAVNGNRYEAVDNLLLGLAVQKLFEQQGHQAKMSRLGNTYRSIFQRASWANEWGADFFLSLHRNASTNTAEHGIETLISTDAGIQAKLAAINVQAKLVDVAGQADRGVKTCSGLAVLSKTNMPAIQVEVGFITNKWDNELFSRYLHDYAAAILAGVLEVFGIQQKPPVRPDMATQWAEEYWNYQNGRGIVVSGMR